MKLFEYEGRVYNADQIVAVVHAQSFPGEHWSTVIFSQARPEFEIEGTPIEVARLIKSWVDVGL